MEKKKVTFSAKIKPLEKLNEEFTKCAVYVCALGKNRNFSYISQDSADDALESLYNIPIIGHLYSDENGEMHMGGHDRVVEKSKDGQYVFKSLCVPYGVVPLQDNVHYEDIEEPNGDVKTYIVADCLLWTGRFPELLDAIYTDDWMFSQSMEINVLDYEPLEEDKNYTNLLRYTYSALCLLGKSDDPEFNTEPCFPESKVVASDYEFEADNTFMTLLNEFKKDLSAYFMKDHGKEGEEIMTEETNKFIDTPDVPCPTTYSATVENEEVVEDGSVEFSAQEAAESNEETLVNDEPATEPAVFENVEEAAKAQFTYFEMAEALRSAMPNSQNVCFYVCDFDDKYVYVEREMYDGSACSCSKLRCEYTYDKATNVATLVGDFVEMYVCWLTLEEKNKLDSEREHYEELIAYKAQREEQDKENAYDVVLDGFADLAGNEEFDSVVANKMSYDSAEALRNACYVVRGKYGLFQKSHKGSEPSVPIRPAVSATLTPREKLHDQYGLK